MQFQPIRTLVTGAVSANQDVTNKTLREKPEEWPPSFAHKLAGWQQSERLTTKPSRTHSQSLREIVDDVRGQLQSNEAHFIRLNVGIKLESSCISPVNTEPYVGQIENLDLLSKITRFLFMQFILAFSGFLGPRAS